jgi:hypothetical protein
MSPDPNTHTPETTPRSLNTHPVTKPQGKIFERKGHSFTERCVACCFTP